LPGSGPSPSSRNTSEPDPKGQRWTVGPDAAGIRLDKFLAAADRLRSRAKAAAALARGKVYLNENEASADDASRPLVPGDTVRVWIDRPGSAAARPRAGTFGDLRIVHEDDRLLIVDKPAGLLSVPLERNPGVPSVYDLVAERFRSHGKRRPLVVHRIDQDTSGLVVFAKDPSAQEHLKAQFKRREPERIYWAVVYGVPDPPAGIWRDRLVWDEKALIQKATHPRDPRGTEAISEYRVIERLRDASLVEVRLRTGRRNQVRLQARLRGHPLVGETRYVSGPDTRRTISFPRHALHARRLVFRHPSDDRTVAFETPPPADFRDLLRRLQK
jgi:23S rRNA pseudouridine1911/1915/1917 synthase